MVGDEDLARRPARPELAVDEREVVGIGESGGAADEVDLAGGHGLLMGRRVPRPRVSMP